ncbi:MAG: phosphatidylglycerol lysyltransferase domain-containing protein [Myxococcota bacterium]|nr:phosphatidylglycerol lysyltransferase domain-containing protein [Myxococcota bacterium]
MVDDRGPASVRTFPRFPAFRGLRLEDREAVTGALVADPPAISDLTFACLRMWKRSAPIEVSTLDGALILVARPQCGPPYALPPVSAERPAEVARTVLETLCAVEGGAFRLRFVPEPLAMTLASSGLRITEERSAADYVYRTRDLIDLPGKRYDAKRNWIRRCLASHACEYEPVASGNVAECVAFTEEWCKDRPCDEDPVLCGEIAAIREAFACWDDLGLVGGVVRVDGRASAYAVGEPLSPTTGVVHFEKADPRVPGLYQLVNNRFCAAAMAEFEFVNREEDMGNPGIRKAKMSYHPVRLVRKYAIGL